MAMARARNMQSARTGDGETVDMPLPIGMRPESVWDWHALLRDSLITIIPPSGAAIYFNTQVGSDEAIPAGISRKRDFRVQLLKADFTPCTDNTPAFLMLVDDSGQRVRFSVDLAR